MNPHTPALDKAWEGKVAGAEMFMLARPRGVTIRDLVLMPPHFDLSRGGASGQVKVASQSLS